MHLAREGGEGPDLGGALPGGVAVLVLDGHEGVVDVEGRGGTEVEVVQVRHALPALLAPDLRQVLRLLQPGCIAAGAGCQGEGGVGDD